MCHQHRHPCLLISHGCRPQLYHHSGSNLPCIHQEFPLPITATATHTFSFGFHPSATFEAILPSPADVRWAICCTTLSALLGASSTLATFCASDDTAHMGPSSSTSIIS